MEITPQQLREAADIKEQGLDWEIKPGSTAEWIPSRIGLSLIEVLNLGWEIRRKPAPPWALGRSINGHTLGEDQQWHRLDWKQEWLTEGTRPLLLGELFIHGEGGDEYECSNGRDGDFHWQEGPHGAVLADQPHQRTRRQLPPVTPKAFQPPPPGHSWHNPDSLTPDQLPEGRRLAVRAEIWAGKPDFVQGASRWHKGSWDKPSEWYLSSSSVTYSLPADMPLQLPPVAPDPYAELKAAHAAGKVIQWQDAVGFWIDQNVPRSGALGYPVERYRIKPVPVMVPLGPDDMTTGCGLHFPETGDYTATKPSHRVGVLGWDENGIIFVVCKRHGHEPQFRYETYENLQKIGATINHVGDIENNKPSWRKCEKEAAQ